jgi:hypothetical protein
VIDEPAVRMAIERVLNGIEHMHRFTRAVSIGNPREFCRRKSKNKKWPKRASTSGVSMRTQPNPTLFNNDDLAFDRLNFVRIKVMKNKFAMSVRDEDAKAPGVPLTPNSNPQIDQVVIITLDEAEVMAAL